MNNNHKNSLIPPYPPLEKGGWRDLYIWVINYYSVIGI
jgi:hypothetical protein